MDPNEPSLELVWSAFTGYQHTAALRAAIELDVFTRIAAGASTVEKLAESCGAAVRGLRILLNFLTMGGFLKRNGDTYELTATASMLLDRNSPAFVGSAIEFIGAAGITEPFDRLTEAVRRGGTAVNNEGTLSTENPIWVHFARAMAPLAGLTGTLLANLLEVQHAVGKKVLDIAAGHGMFGIALAQANPDVEVTALDWQNVLTVAKENAEKAGVAKRLKTLPGSAFDVAYGEDYDTILLPNFLHHFDPAGCEKVLAKCRAALRPGGHVVIVEFVPDDDRSGPPDAVRFGLVMLATTPSGDAYTFREYSAMLQKAGFRAPALHDLPPSPARVIMAQR